MKALQSVGLFFVVGCSFLAGILSVENNPETHTIRTHHRLTPRLELIIDSGRVDTVFIYKAERK